MRRNGHQGKPRDGRQMKEEHLLRQLNMIIDLMLLTQKDLLKNMDFAGETELRP